jgi:hypothetical protein
MKICTQANLASGLEQEKVWKHLDICMNSKASVFLVDRLDLLDQIQQIFKILISVFNNKHLFGICPEY